MKAKKQAEGCPQSGLSEDERSSCNGRSGRRSRPRAKRAAPAEYQLAQSGLDGAQAVSMPAQEEPAARVVDGRGVRRANAICSFRIPTLNTSGLG